MWKPVVGFEGAYEVSDLGEVRSVDRWIVFADGRRRFYPGQLLAQYPGVEDYRRVTLKANGRSLRENVQVLVALAFLGPRPPGKWVCHNDGNGANNRLGNLRYDTPTANSVDRWAHGTMVEVHGDRIPVETVRAIRAEPAGKTISELAAKFGVSRTTLWNICNGKRRATVKNL
jgi:hypothetical protein